MLTDHDQELSRLLALYRKGHISEGVLLRQMREIENEEARTPDRGGHGVQEQDDSGVPDATTAAQPDSDVPAAATTEAQSDKSASAGAAPLASLLDDYRVAEASGAEALRIWAGLSRDPVLIGGLRTIAAREAAHASLLEERVRELGGDASAETPQWMSEYNASITDPDASDLDRLAALVAQFPDVAEAVAPLQQAIDAIEDDDLTKELLQTICQDEVATLEWIHSAFSRCRTRHDRSGANQG